MIELRDVSKKYGRVEALHGVSVSFPSTGLVAVRGNNGSGKSTLVGLISGLNRATTGSIEVFGQDLSKMNEKELSSYRERYVSIVFQDDNLFDEMSVEENLKIIGKSNNFDKVIHELKLEFLLNRKIKELSGGERKRVAIARALMKRSKILIADEPAISIDIDTKKLIYSVLYNYSKTALVIIVSHGEEYVDRLASSIIFMKDGAIEEQRFIRNNGFENVHKAYRNEFDYRNFAKKNLFQNKKKLVRSSSAAIVMFLFIFLFSSLGSIDSLKMAVDTMMLEDERTMTITKYEKDGFTKNEVDLILASSDFGNEFTVNRRLRLSPSMYGSAYTDFATEIPIEERTNARFTLATSGVNVHDVADLEKVDYGELPREAHEIVITSYMARLFMECGVKNNRGEYYYPSTVEAIVDDNVVLDLGGIDVTVSGIIKVDLERFENGRFTRYSRYLLEQLLNTAYYNIYVDEMFYELVDSVDGYADVNSYLYEESSLKKLDVKEFTSPVTLVTGEVVESLASGEIIVDRNLYMDVCSETGESCIGQEIELVIGNYETNESTRLGNFVIRGVGIDDGSYVDVAVLKTLEAEKVVIYSMSFSVDDKDTIVDILTNKREKYDGIYEIESNYTGIFKNLENSLKEYVIIFKLGSIAFIAIGILVLINYIFDSIDNHKREIAILKSLGVRNDKIMLSFLAESLNVVVTSFIYSLIAFFIVRIIVNVAVSRDLMFSVNVTPIRIEIYLLALLSAILVNFVITFGSIFKLKSLSPKDLFARDSI